VVVGMISTDYAERLDRLNRDIDRSLNRWPVLPLGTDRQESGTHPRTRRYQVVEIETWKAIEELLLSLWGSWVTLQLDRPMMPAEESDLRAAARTGYALHRALYPVAEARP